MAYLDGYITAVPADRRDAYLAFTAAAFALFREKGAVASRENWGDDVPEGKLTSFPMAVRLEPGEVVVFSWIEWPDRATRDAGMRALYDDPRMRALEMPFDGRRMIFGGFETIAVYD